MPSASCPRGLPRLNSRMAGHRMILNFTSFGTRRRKSINRILPSPSVPDDLRIWCVRRAKHQHLITDKRKEASRLSCMVRGNATATFKNLAGLSSGHFRHALSSRVFSGRAFDFPLTLPAAALVCANRPAGRVKGNSSRPRTRRSSSQTLLWRCRKISSRRCHIPRTLHASR